MKNVSPQYRSVYPENEGKRPFVSDQNLQLSLPHVNPLDIEKKEGLYSLQEIAHFLEEIYLKKTL